MKLELSRHVATMAVNLVKRLDLSLPEVVRGLDVEPERLAREGRGLSWDDLTHILERLEDIAGYDRLEAISANIPALATDTRAYLSTFISPVLLYRFIDRYLVPTMYPMHRSTHEELDDGTIVFTSELPDGFRPSYLFFKLSRAAHASIPCFVGLPPAEIRAHVTEYGCKYWITPPKARSLRRRRPFLEESEAHASALAEMQNDKERLREAYESLWRMRDTGLARKLVEAERRFGLTERQRQVLSGLARGAANKDIARELGCSPKRVEAHVTELLRRSGCSSRLELVATFWRDL